MKHFMMVAIMSLATTALRAQIAESGMIPNDRNDWFIPAQYSFDGKPHIVTLEDIGEEYNRYAITVYDSNFDIVKSFNTVSGATSPDYYFNYDTETSYGDLHVIVTQTLFNDDEKYEYLVRNTEVNEEGRPITASYSIVSEDGEVLQTITPENGLKMGNSYYVTIGGKGYLKLNMGKGRNEHGDLEDICSYYYSKSDNGSGIRQVGVPIRTKVHPSIVNRNESITVEIDGNESDRKTVTVYDATGRSVYRSAVPDGQKRMNISTASFGQGVNVVSVTDGKHDSDSGKVIVK